MPSRIAVSVAMLIHLWILLVGPVRAEECPYGALNPEAPEETAQFAFLIGQWRCSVRRIGSDGTLGEATSALWTGRYILDGWAIQDDWVATGADGKVRHGMNVRSYDRGRRKWDNRWLAAGSLEWLFFESEQKGDRMVMRGERRDSSGRTFIARNVFHDFRPDSWKWRQDRSFDGGETWLEGVVVIDAQREAGCVAEPREVETPSDPEALTALEIPVGDLVFDALAAGPSHGELVLMLHGFPQTSYCWRHQMPRLGEAGYRVVAPNQRGYSRRARPEAVDAYAIGRLADDVIGMADALGADRFHLVGHDWGGAVAWVVATRYPSRLHTLSVLSTPHFRAFSAALTDPDSSQRERSGYFARFAAEGAEKDFLDEDAAGLRELFSGSNLTRSDMDQYVRVLGEPAAMRAALRWYAAMTAPATLGARGAGGSAPTRVAPIRVPTLYAWGTEDAAFSRDAAEATAEYVAGPYRFEVLEGIGHWVPETAADRVTALLLQQLGQVSRGNAAGKGPGPSDP